MSSAANSNLVKSYFFEATDKPNGELVCYVAGFGSPIRSYRQAIRTLQTMGFDVLAFDYDRAILEAGQPQFLIDVIDDVTRLVTKTSRRYTQTICMGVSLGSFIAYTVQKRVPNAYIGAYAAGGVEIIDRLFTLRIFKKTAAALKRNGFSPAKIGELWRDLDVSPTLVDFPAHKSIVVYEGTGDRIVRYKEAKQNIQNWAAHGIRVKMYTLRGRGHLLTAIYFIRNTRRIISKAKQHHAETIK